METLLFVTLLGLGSFGGPTPPARVAPLPASLGISRQATVRQAADSTGLAGRPGLAALRRDRTTNVVVGGLIGGALGIAACTAISNLVKDPGTGFSTCTESGYLAFGLGGIALGALVGAAIR